MNAVRGCEALVSGPEDRQCPGDAAQLTESREAGLKEQLPSDADFVLIPQWKLYFTTSSWGFDMKHTFT
ncbi:Protein IWS1 like A [Dissostichus eleginoides]|uniref:Protein IWS1 like A n=1 Tax=Dissostichus eleginoides TaxID=100907 RepID=A0AAD9CSP7_DISEL|nr:Protein IWS1 like A [Dissostichus eleginoides]